MFCYHLAKDCFYFRIFGYGLHFIDRSKHKPPFSIRAGKVKEYKIGNWGFKFLRKDK